MEKKSVENRLAEIERKLDLILSALGLDGKPRMTPAQREEDTKITISNWVKRRSLRTMELINPRTGKMKCKICGFEHFASEFKPKSLKKHHCINGCLMP